VDFFIISIRITILLPGRSRVAKGLLKTGEKLDWVSVLVRGIRSDHLDEKPRVSYNHSKTMKLIRNHFGFQLRLRQGSLIALGKGICPKAKGTRFEGLIAGTTESFQ